MKNLIFATSLVFCLNAGAEVNEQALSQTQDLLTNKQLRDQHIKESSTEAQKALDILRSMGMTKSQEASLMDISSDVLEEMLRDSRGDIDKIKSRLASGAQDPESMLKSLTEKSQSRLRELSSEVEGSQNNERK